MMPMLRAVVRDAQGWQGTGSKGQDLKREEKSVQEAKTEDDV